MVGDQREDQYGPISDFEFLWARGVAEKVEYVFRTTAFERIVIPSLERIPDHSSERQRLTELFTNNRRIQSAQLNATPTLQTAADCIIGQIWRQQFYIRCPDVSWALAHPDRFSSTGTAGSGTESCYSLISNNEESSVLELPGASAISVAGALQFLNRTLRHQIDDRRPPLLSCAFIRAIPEEQDERFWRVVWQTMGAPEHSFLDLRRSPTPSVAARHVAAMLNQFEPTTSNPGFRAPDVLVIIGTRRFEESLKTTYNPRGRYLAVPSVVRELRRSRRLQPHPHPHMRDLLGVTRVILLPDDEPCNAIRFPMSSRPRQGDDRDTHTLAALSIFRFSFTQHMAARVLETVEESTRQEGGAAIRDTLERLVNEDRLRKTAGEYHIPGGVAADLGYTVPEPGEERSIGPASVEYKKHFAAGLSLAPYVSPTAAEGLPLLTFA